MAWREGEDDLQATIEDSVRSAGKSAIVFPVEDKTGAGPAQTRHRGIVAAKEAGCDVVCIVDAHMRFDGNVLQLMARQVRRDGKGLLCAMCHHNAACSFVAAHPSGAGYYAGAEIHYKGEDQNGQQALVWKWSEDGKPGPRACVGGACYVFPVAWYFDVGQPLAALPAWGCDEEALSISAWLSGVQPTVFNGHVAHQWRPRPPWKSAANPLKQSRAALILATVTDKAEIDDLSAWQGCKPTASPAVARWRAALLKQPRTFAQWKATVPVMPEVKLRVPRANYSANETKRLCRQCGCPDSSVTNTRRTGRVVLRYRTCADCGARRVTRDICATV